MIPAYRNVILYILVNAVAVPTFTTFSYYFLLDEVGLSKFNYSLLTVLGYFCLLIGS